MKSYDKDWRCSFLLKVRVYTWMSDHRVNWDGGTWGGDHLTLEFRFPGHSRAAVAVCSPGEKSLRGRKAVGEP